MCEIQVPRVKKIIMWFGNVGTIDYKVFLLTSHILVYGALRCPI